ncbi:FUN14 family-domain-containing protein [Zychaea mexicana]|uniref:FUN14 family-domain-containing protein n=1 Tax=Zychaea mexicana TaxID=64656 RepID=UPI0022FF377B|nr:FUN14 family-domain-containing protein [Zychaea mexicana]KAI9492189.1 FUN14 family-domain-containing protein [Zychaea mexicana]
MPGAPPSSVDATHSFSSVFDETGRKPSDAEVGKTLFHKGELSFGIVLGFCTGYLIKKVGKLFALAVGAGYIFLQYLSFKGLITVHWDRLEGGYQRQLDVDKDGRVTHKDVRTKWNGFVGILTHNIQFKSTFMIGLYTGIRYG